MDVFIVNQLANAKVGVARNDQSELRMFRRYFCDKIT